MSLVLGCGMGYGGGTQRNTRNSKEYEESYARPVRYRVRCSLCSSCSDVSLLFTSEHHLLKMFHHHDMYNSRIKQVIFCQAEDQPIPRSEIVKGYEYEKDHYVVVEDEDIKRMAPSTAKVMEILEFVKSVEVDPLYFESSFYMAPDSAGEKPYALLYDTLKRTGYVGVAKIAMHNREHIVIFRPGDHGILMHTMYFTHEVRKVEEFRTDLSLVKDQEVKLAQMLVESLAASFEPQKYKDTYRDNLQALIDAKINGQEVVTPPAAEPTKVVDIMEALKKSLAIAKKPMASEAAMEVEAPKQKAVGKKQKTARG